MTFARPNIALLILLAVAVPATGAVRIEWDRSTLVLVQRGGAYGRIVRVPAGLVSCFELRRRVCVRRSGDDGRTWGPQVDAAAYPPGSAANPELLACHDGRLLLSFNGRPRDGRSPYTIESATSGDGGLTWIAADRPLYVAGTRGGDGCYEPAAVELPGGPVQLFFANEHGHAADRTQEIDRLTSGDGGRTWSAPECVSYRPGGRDGMPVPVLAVDGRSILLAIEDNGFGDHQLRPTIEQLPLTGTGPPIGANDGRRWPAVIAPPWPRGAYAGAPYLRRLPGGQTVLACQPDVAPPGVQRAAVYAGDDSGHDFRRVADPFPDDAGQPAQWNSLFVKDATTATAVSTATVGGVRGVWAVDGRVVGP